MGAPPSAPKISGRALWLVERSGVELIDPVSAKREFLPYPLAAIWDLLTRGYGEPEIRSMVALIADMSPGESAALAASALESWRREGWIETGGPL